MTVRLKILPRDIEPGDRIDRIDTDMNFVTATVREVKKVRRFDRTTYKVYLAEEAEIPESRRGWAEYRHLSPFVLQPSSKIEVERNG